MRRHAKASSAGSTEGSGNSRGLFRRASATRGSSGDSKGSGAPSGRAARFGLAALLALALTAFLAPSALAAVFGSPTTIAGQGTDNGQLAQFPGRAAVEQSTGNLFVADQGNNRIQVFKPNGSDGADYLTQFGAPGLSAPWGIAIDENAGQTFVYVADAGNNRIVKYASDEAATPSFTVVGSGSFELTPDKVGNFKAALAVDSISHDLLVADKGKNLIERFGANGAFISSFTGATGAGSPGAFKGPLDVAVNSTGDIYLIDANGPDIGEQKGTSQALRYSAAGSYKATLSPVGSRQRPATVAVNPANGEVVVSGQQDSIYGSDSPTLHVFDSANSPLYSSTIRSQYGSLNSRAVSGLAIASGSADHLYVVVSPGLHTGNPYGNAELVSYKKVEPPTATIAPVSNLEGGTVTVNGSVNPGGGTTTCHFEYSTDTSFSNSAPCAEDPPGKGTDPVTVHANLTGLSPETTYNFRLVATNDAATATSGTGTFTTPHVDPPVAIIAAATNVAELSATVNGSVNPMGSPATCRFEYSIDTSFANSVPCAEENLGKGTGLVPVHADLIELSPDSTYNVRLVAINAAASPTSTTGTFTTLHVDQPTLVIDPSTVTPYTISLSGSANPHGFNTTARFEYSGDNGATWTQLAPHDSTTDPGLAASTSPVAIADQITGLQANKTYKVRISGANPAGPAQSPIESITTAVAAPKVETLSPAQTADTSALLRGRINPNNQATTYRFEIGTSTSYGRVVPVGPEASVGGGGVFTVALSSAEGLSAGTTYHYRLVATNATGTSFGGDRSFTTRATRTCSNEAFRTGLAANLPECRAYEMVSPPGKNSGDIDPGRTVQTDVTGDRVAFPSTMALPGAQSSPIFSYYQAGRSADGWSSAGLDVPMLNDRAFLFFGTRAVSADLSKSMQVSLEALAPGAVQGNGNIYLQDNETRARRLIVSGPPSLYDGATGGGGQIFRDATPDFSHILFSAGDELLPDATKGFGNLYEWSEEDGLRVVNKLPGGAISPTGSYAEAGPPAISSDGSRLVFGAAGALYLRENGTVTKAITVSQRSGDSDEPQPATLLTITPDGSYVFFGSRTPLTNDSHEPSEGFGGDIYRYDVDTEELEDLTVPPAVAESGNVSQFIGAGSSGDRMYYMAEGAMTPDAISGRQNIYEWHNGTTHLIVTLHEQRSFGEGLLLSSSVSPSANHLSFMETGESTGYDNRSPDCEALPPPGSGSGVGACLEVFTYDAATQDLQCASCNFTSRPLGDAELTTGPAVISNYHSRATLDNGKVFFNTKDSLSPQDTNGRVDVYQWDAGEVSLISSGTSTADSTFQDASPDGSNVFFATSQRLVPQDVDNNVDIYDARVDGGLAAQQIDPELEVRTCGGETCRTAVSGAPPGAGPATNAFQGPPNKATPRKHCPKARKGKGSKAKNSKAKCRQTHKKKAKKKNSAKRAQGANAGSGK